MHPTAKGFLVAVVVAALAGGAWYATRDQQDAKNNAGRQRNQVQTVRTALAEKKPIPISVTANGSVTAFNTVEVRPQSQNIIRAIHVKEGQDVKAGQLLFTLDERTDAALADRARAQAERSKADLADAELALKRNQELAAKGFVSPSVVDSARNRVEALRSAWQADVANARSNAVSLGNNRIVASIDGRIGVINAHVGTLAQPSATLVTIARMDPIMVTFSVPQSELHHVVASYPKGGAPVTAQLPGGRQVEGKLVFIDNQVDAATGTIRMKAQFDNRDRALWPGAFATVKLVTRTLPDAVAVPAQAVVTGPAEQFVYVVQPDSTVKMQKVRVEVIANGVAALTGLAPGARVVVEGNQNLRPGTRVQEQVAANGGPGSKSGKGSQGAASAAGAVLPASSRATASAPA